MYDYDGNGVLDKNDFEVLLVCNIDFDIPVLDDNMFEEKKHIIINVELMCQIYFFLNFEEIHFSVPGGEEHNHGRKGNVEPGQVSLLSFY